MSYMLTGASVLMAASLLTADERRDPTTKQLGSYLQDMGDSLNVYFTVESMAPTKASPRAYLDREIAQGEGIRTVDSLVEHLRSELKGTRVVRNAKIKQVIHLLDISEVKTQDYAIEKQVAIDYDDLLYKLPHELGQQLEGIDALMSGVFGSNMHFDLVTHVEIHAKDESVRNILTMGVPLSKYSRVIWDAQTRQLEDGWMTYVRYHGPQSDESPAEK